MGDPNSNPFDSFRTTIWAEIEKLDRLRGSTRADALTVLLTRYLPALRAHLVLKKRIRPEQADDLLQGFVADKIIERNLFEQADQSKGKLRALLVRSLENYVVDQFRSRSRDIHDALETSPELSETELPNFIDVAWARQVIEETVAAVRADCLHHNQDAIWRVFEHRLLRPLQMGTTATPYKDLVKQLGFESVRQAENALISAKRKFVKAFSDTAGAYLEDGQELEHLVAELRHIVSSAGMTDWGDVSSYWPDPDEDLANLRIVLDSVDLRSVDRLLDSETSRRHWCDDDLSQMLDHELNNPLAGLVAQLHGTLERHAPIRERTLLEVLQSSDSRLPMLEAIKRYAKDQAVRNAGSDSSEQTAVYSVIYFCAIAAALIHHKARITSSTDEALEAGLAIVIAYSWIDDSTRELLSRARTQLSGRTES